MSIPMTAGASTALQAAEVRIEAGVSGRQLGRVGALGGLVGQRGGWKLRAVGQGYADGLAGIATGFGIRVDDPAETAPAAVPAVPAITPTNSADLRPNLDQGHVVPENASRWC